MGKKKRGRGEGRKKLGFFLNRRRKKEVLKRTTNSSSWEGVRKGAEVALTTMGRGRETKGRSVQNPGW